MRYTVTVKPPEPECTHRREVEAYSPWAAIKQAAADHMGLTEHDLDLDSDWDHRTATARAKQPDEHLRLLSDGSRWPSEMRPARHYTAVRNAYCS